MSAEDRPNILDDVREPVSSAPGETSQPPEGMFYRGLIVYLDRVRGRGAIRSYSGREIPFQFPHVSMIGAPIGGRAPGIDRLNQGDTVGFDVGWTSKGLRITQIKHPY